LDKPLVKRRNLGKAANIFLAAAERNARRASPVRLDSSERVNAWAIPRLLTAAACALLLGAVIGVLLPR
jgi:hypothetical protein